MEDPVAKHKANEYQVLLHEILDVVWVLDLTEQKFVYVSPAVERLRGYTVEEVLNQPVEASLTPESAEKVAKLTGERLPDFFANPDNPVVRVDEIDQPHKDGHIVHTEAITYYRFNKRTGHVEVVGTSRDITERKKAEKEKQRISQTFDKAFENSNIGVCLVSLEGVLTKVNKKMAEIFGMTPEELTGQSVADIAIPENKQTSQKYIDKAVQGDTTKTTFEKKYHHKKGHIITCNVSSSLVHDENGEPLYFISHVEDITMRKKMHEALTESERRYRKIFHHNQSIMLLIDPETAEIIDANEAAAEYYQVPLKQLVGKLITEISILIDDDPERMLTEMAQNEEFNTTLKHRLMNDSHERYAEVFTTKISIKEKPLLFSVIHDITLQKEAEQKLQESEKKLKISNEAKDRFLSILAHDLRSPFNTLIGFSEILLEDYEEFSDVERKGFIKKMLNSSRATYDLLEEILTWAKSQSEKTTVEKENFNLHELIENTIRLSKDAARKKSIEIDNTVEGDITVNADKNMIGTVIRNLITNAIKFSSAKDSIVIEAIPIEKDNRVQVNIIDRGVGINPEDMKKLFRIETSYSTTGTDNEKGTGLGLVLCKEFIEKNDGDIWAKSKPGAGSTFSFTLQLS